MDRHILPTPSTVLIITRKDFGVQGPNLVCSPALCPSGILFLLVSGGIPELRLLNYLIFSGKVANSGRFMDAAGACGNGIIRAVIMPNVVRKGKWISAFGLWRHAVANTGYLR